MSGMNGRCVPGPAASPQGRSGVGADINRGPGGPTPTRSWPVPVLQAFIVKGCHPATLLWLRPSGPSPSGLWPCQLHPWTTCPPCLCVFMLQVKGQRLTLLNLIVTLGVIVIWKKSRLVTN